MVKLKKKIQHPFLRWFFVIALFFFVAFYFQNNSDKSAVNAYYNKVNVYPGVVSIDENVDYSFNNKDNSLIHKLSENADFDEFHQDNSSYLFVGNEDNQEYGDKDDESQDQDQTSSEDNHNENKNENDNNEGEEFQSETDSQNNDSSQDDQDKSEYETNATSSSNENDLKAGDNNEDLDGKNDIIDDEEGVIDSQDKVEKESNLENEGQNESNENNGDDKIQDETDSQDDESENKDGIESSQNDDLSNGDNDVQAENVIIDDQENGDNEEENSEDSDSEEMDNEASDDDLSFLDTLKIKSIQGYKVLTNVKSQVDNYGGKFFKFDLALADDVDILNTTTEQILVDFDDEIGSSTEEIVEENQDAIQNYEIKSSLIYSDFGFFEEIEENSIENIQLRASFAYVSNFSDDKILLEYSIGDEWKEIGQTSIGNIFNKSNQGYFLYALPLFNDVEKLNDLQIRFSYLKENKDVSSGYAKVYVDSLWLEVDYAVDKKEDADESAFDQIENVVDKVVDKIKTKEQDEDLKTITQVLEEKKIKFEHTDENSGEKLIIKSDKKSYYGLTSAMTYFSITNTGDDTEYYGIQTYFPKNKGKLQSLKKWTRDIPYNTIISEYGTKIVECDSGWNQLIDYGEFRANNFYKCASTSEIVKCDFISNADRSCYQSDVFLRKKEGMKLKNDWEEVKLISEGLKDNRNALQKLFKIGPNRKKIKDEIVAKESTNEKMYRIEAGETQYFKAKIIFPKFSKGEFYIEAVGGNKNYYGLLDPWWETNWSYKRSVNIEYSGDDLTDYQVVFEVDTDSLIDAGKMQSDCDDIRILNSSEATSTELNYWIEDNSCNSSSTRIWTKVPSITGNKTIYMYYGNASSTAMSSGNDTFVYFNDFEDSIDFDSGNLSVATSSASAKYGSLGIEADGGSGYSQAFRDGINSGRNLVWETWVREDSGSSNTSLGGIGVGHQNGDADRNGYQAVIDPRGSPYFFVREDYQSGSPLCTDNSNAVLQDTWYFVQLKWEDNGGLTGSVYSNPASSTPILTCSANDTTYTDGEYGVSAYQMADWDNYSQLVLPKFIIDLEMMMEMRVLQHGEMMKIQWLQMLRRER